MNVFTPNMCLKAANKIRTAFTLLVTSYYFNRNGIRKKKETKSISSLEILNECALT